MDLRRTARVEDVYFGLGDDTRGKIRWYVAPPGAKWWTDPTPFRSLDWWDGLSPLPDRPGPVKYQLGAYDKGATPAGVTGQGFCGAPDYFENGVPSPPPQLPAGGGNECACCLGIRSGQAAFSGFSSAVFSSFLPLLDLYYVYTAGGPASPVVLHWSDSAALFRLFVVQIAAKADDPRSLSLAVPAGWTLAADTVNTQTRQWVLFLGDAPAAHDNQTFAVTGSAAWVFGNLAAWSGVDPSYSPESIATVTGPGGNGIDSLAYDHPSLANGIAVWALAFVPYGFQGTGGQGPGQEYFGVTNIFGSDLHNLQFFNHGVFRYANFLHSEGPWILTAIVFAGARQPNHDAIAVWTGRADFGPAAIAARPGAAALDGVSAFAAVSGIRTGAATLDGSGDLAAVGVQLAAGLATLDGSGDLAAVGVQLAAGVTTLDGSGDLAAVAGTTHSAAATFAGSGDLAAVGAAALAGAAAFDGTGLFSPTRNVPVKLRAIGTATVVTGGANPTFAGVNLATNEKLIICVLNVAGGPTGITWGAAALAKDATSTVTVGGRVYGLTVWSLPIGNSGTQTVTVSVGGAASVITAHTLSPIALTAVQASATASGTSTAPTSGATGTPAHSPGALFCAVALHLLNNGTNTIGTWTSPIFNSLDISLHQTTMTTPLDFWLTTGYRDYATPDPVSLAAAKTGVTSCEWAAAAVAYE